MYNSDIGFFHVFKTSSGFYLYDVNTDVILQISERLFYKLNDLKNINDVKNDEEYLRLKEKGFLKTKTVKKSLHPSTESVDVVLSQSISAIVLQVTQNCNLRCDYCIYSGGYSNREHSNKRMGFETAKNSIDYLISNSKSMDRLSIGFYGGEPLLEFDLIKECILYAESKIKDKRLNFSITTNATLLTIEMYEFFRSHNTTLTISLDGPQEVHDRQRMFSDGSTGTHSKVINILNKIYKLYPEDMEDHVIINVVADQRYDFKKINDFFNKDIFDKTQVTFSLVNNDYAKEKRNISETFKKELNFEFFKIYLRILGRLDSSNKTNLLKTNEYMIGISRVDKIYGSRFELPDISHHGGPCIPGQTSLFVDVNGVFYPCEKVPEDDEFYIIGDINKGIDIDKVKELMNIETCMGDKCRRCWAYDYCSICIANSNCKNCYCSEQISKKCPQIRKEVESDFKNYVLLTEAGYDFEAKRLRGGLNENDISVSS